MQSAIYVMRQYRFGNAVVEIVVDQELGFVQMNGNENDGSPYRESYFFAAELCKRRISVALLNCPNF